MTDQESDEAIFAAEDARNARRAKTFADEKDRNSRQARVLARARAKLLDFDPCWITDGDPPGPRPCEGWCEGWVLMRSSSGYGPLEIQGCDSCSCHLTEEEARTLPEAQSSLADAIAREEVHAKVRAAHAVASARADAERYLRGRTVLDAASHVIRALLDVL